MRKEKELIANVKRPAEAESFKVETLAQGRRYSKCCVFCQQSNIYCDFLFWLLLLIFTALFHFFISFCFLFIFSSSFGAICSFIWLFIIFRTETVYVAQADAERIKVMFNLYLIAAVQTYISDNSKIILSIAHAHMYLWKLVASNIMIFASFYIIGKDLAIFNIFVNRG